MAGIKATESQLLYLLFVTTAFVTARRGEFPRYRTAYACEGGQLRISCEEEHLIHLLRANYGRFSISICNEHGNLDWSVDCTSHKSYYVIDESCGMKKSCSLLASSAVFGDPCPGTLKYLEAHYQCVTEESTSTVHIPSTTTTSTTTTTTRPPIIIPITRFSRPVTATTLQASTTPRPSMSHTMMLSTLPVLSSIASSNHDEIITSESGTFTTPPSNVTSTAFDTSTHYIKHTLPNTWCSPSEYKSLIWNWTRAGEIVLQKCPGSASGLAKWQCNGRTATWFPDYPDLSECNSLWVENLKHRIIVGDSVASIAAELESITRTKSMYGGDVLQAMEIIHKLISKMADRINDMTDEKQRRQLLEDFLEFILDISNNLLEDRGNIFWKELPRSEQKRAVSGLIHGLERSGWLLADTQNNRYRLSRSQPSVLMTVRVVEAWTVSDIKFPSPEDVDDTPWMRMEDSLVLSSQAITESTSTGVVKLVLMAYNRVDEFLGVDVLYKPAPPISSANEMEKALNSTQIINTRVIAASVDGYHMVRLAHPATIILKHMQVENVTNPHCVFWDFNMRIWSTEGCWIVGSNLTHTICQCEHLTNFAVIMDVSATKIGLHDSFILRIITYIGCAVCMLFLLVTLLVLHFYRSMKTDRITIHKHLCSCLLFAESIFVGGIDQTQLPILCSVLSGFLHYFLLTAFAWMFLENFQLYVMLVEVFESEKSRLRWYYAVAYGVPLLVVGISAVIDPYSFGTERYCWLRVDNYYIFSFVGPAIACAMASMLFLGLIVCRICCQSSGTAAKSKEQTKLTSAKVWSGEAFVLLLILGSTWALSLLYLHEELPIIAYIFTAFNSLLGFLIFAFYCVKNDKVRKALHKSARKTSWLPECLRPSHNQDSRSHLYSQSNGAITGSGQQSLRHQNWNSCKVQGYTKPNAALPHCTMRDHLSVATLSNYEAEEHPMRNLRHITGKRQSPPEQIVRPSSSEYDVRWNNATLPRDHVKWKECSRGSAKSDEDRIAQVSENIYDTIDDETWAVEKYDLFSGWERRNCSRSNQNIISSLTAVLTGSPRSRHLPLLRDSYLRPQVAYSGIHSPTDSERSSSSLMDERGRVSSSLSPDVASSNDYEANDPQSLQSLPNLLNSNGVDEQLTKVSKYPSDNMVLVSGPEDKIL